MISLPPFQTLLFTAACYFLFSGVVSAQTSLSSDPTQKWNFNLTTGTPGLNFNADTQSRFNSLYYNDVKIHGLQVVSFYQPYTNYDFVYFIDAKGNTQYISYAPTSALNFDPARRSGMDSLNPYGSCDVGGSLIAGMLNLFLGSKRLRFSSYNGR